MPVTLSIKNAPDAIVDRLRERARRSHRSLQGELMAIIEAAAAEATPSNLTTVADRVRALGHTSAADSVDIVRADRDRRR
jgi:antitoxin FitA